MLKTTFKGLLARKRRLVTTALAVTLGVAFMAGTLVLTDTIGKTFDDLFSDVYRDTDAVVRAKAQFEGPEQSGDQRGRVEASLLDAVRAVEGVAYAEGGAFGYARLVGKDGEAIGEPAMGPPTLGGNWSEVDELNPFTLVAGRAPQADDEVAIDKKSADDGGLAVGDTTTVLVQGPPRQVRVAGIVKFGSADSPGGASFVLFTPAIAQQVIAEPGKFDSINVLADDGVSQSEVARRIAPVLPGGTEVLTGTAITEETQSDVREFFKPFRLFMLVFAVVALIVGGFMIFNTFSITVAQRTRENGLLRALGASRRQVLGSVLLEALLVGAVAGVVGLAAGVLVAGGLKAMMAGLGMDLPSGGVVFRSNTVVVSLVSGIGVTLVAALSPARKAAKVAPVAAMRAETAGSTGYGSRERILIGVAVLALGVGALFAGLFGHVSNGLAMVGLGVLLVFFGVSTLARTISLPLSRFLGAPLPRFRGTAGVLARENAMRNPKRTAASASALMIGVGLVGFITILASSTKASFYAAIDRSFSGDLVVDSGVQPGFGGLDPEVAQRLGDLPQVAAATGVRTTAAQVEGKARFLTGLDRTGAFDIIDVRPLEGSTGDLGRDAIGVSEDEADERGFQLGDTVRVLFKDAGPQTLRVALIYGEHQPSGPYILGLEAYDAYVADQFDTRVLVKGAPGVTPAALRAAVEGVAKDYPAADVFDPAKFKKEQTAWVDQMLALVYVLLMLAVVIALLGIANTMALSIFERTRELGVLRAVGMTREQLRSTIRWEAVIIALQGTVLGLVIGVFFAWAIVGALDDWGIDRLDIPVSSLAVIVVVAVLAGRWAARRPSARAAKLDVLQAIATQ